MTRTRTTRSRTPTVRARRLGLAALALGATASFHAAAAPATLRAEQNPTPAAAPAQPARQSARPDPSGLLLRREEFAWPEGPARDPFQPLAAGPLGRGRPEEIELLGLLHHPDPGLTLVLLRMGARAAAETPEHGARREPSVTRLRLGEARGGLEIVEIGSRHVVVRFGADGRGARRLLALSRPTLRIES